MGSLFGALVQGGEIDYALAEDQRRFMRAAFCMNRQKIDVGHGSILGWLFAWAWAGGRSDGGRVAGCIRRQANGGRGRRHTACDHDAVAKAPTQELPVVRR